MGADSHPCIEVKGKNGRWGLHDEKGRYWKLREAQNLSYEELEALKPSYIRALGDRSYWLFAALADVRNGGFGRGKFITPLFPHRDFPPDVSKATEKEIPKDGDYHSHTWFTLRELQETNWDAVAGTEFEVCIYAADYMEWKETGNTAGAVDHPENMDETTREVSHEEMMLLLIGTPGEELTQMLPDSFPKARKKKAQKVRSGPFVRVEASRTYRQIIPHFIETIPDLAKLGEPDKVRVVIAFDN